MLNRREVLMCSLGAAALPLVGCTANAAYVRAEQTGTLLRVDRRAVEAAGLEKSSIIYVESIGASLSLVPALETHADGSVTAVAYKALLLICTHRGCNVAPARAGFICPCHGSTFSDDGNVTAGPADRPLTELPVALSEDFIIVDLESILEANAEQFL